MATEIVTNYPLLPWQEPMDSFADRTLQRVLDKLGMIEQRLSRIEQQLSKQQPTE